MANFVPGDASPITDIKPWSPDWSFLEQVYGVTQVRYDRGFNTIKNLYNSVLNSPLTNSENQAYRNQMFQKIQGSLRNVSALDLSNPTNVMRAEKLLDPIVEDKEIAYDRYVTRYLSEQETIMNKYKNSTDPKIRNQYNDYSKMDIYDSKESMANAKRGDGSIMSVQPRDFVPFEDVNEYLNDLLKKSKLKVQYSVVDGKGYIYDYTNGETARKPFSVWAKTMMGNRFDRQFEVIGRVTSEAQIKDRMKGKGITRQQAISEISSEYVPNYTETEKKDLEQLIYDSNDNAHQLQLIKQLYPNGIPSDKPQLIEKYMQLKESANDIKNEKDNTQLSLKKLEENANEYVMLNLASLYSKEAKKQAAINWGVSVADATSDVTIRPDQKVINDMNRSAANARAAADRELKLWMFNKNLQFKEKALASKNEIDNAKIEMAKAKLKKEGVKLSSETLIGTMLGTSSPAVGIVSEAGIKNRKELFDNVFGAKDGLINLVIPNQSDYGKYYAALAKVQGIAQNSGEILSDNEMNLLRDYSKMVKIPNSQIDLNFKDDPAKASSYLEQLASNTYHQATETVKYLTSTKSSENKKYVSAFENTLSAMKKITQDREDIDKAYKQLANMMYDAASGQMKPGYENVKVVSRNAQGVPIFDPSSMTDMQKETLNNVLGTQWTNRKNPVGTIWTFEGVKQDEAFALVNKNNTITVTLDNDDEQKFTPEEMKKLNPSAFMDLIGDEFRVAFDPGARKAIVELGVDPSSKVFSGLKLPNNPKSMKIEIPYELIESSANPSLSRFKAGIKKNNVSSSPYGIMEEFSRNPRGTVHAPSYMANAGFDWTATGSFAPNGRYGVNLDFKLLSPEEKACAHHRDFIELDPSNPEEYNKVSEYIDKLQTWYEGEVDGTEELISGGEVIGYDELGD
jgi:hypothetical protein